MTKAIIGKKVGMTSIFAPDGRYIPVTVVEAGPCVVTQIKTVERDGYSAVQVAYDDVAARKLSKAELGHLKKAEAGAKKVLKEFKFTNAAELNVGNVYKCDVFALGDIVDVCGFTRGRGFSGVIQRHNQHRLKMTHGTGPVHREVGSMGANSTPSRVLKGKNLPGHYGHERVTIQNLEVVKVDTGRNVLLIKGSVPGPNGSYVTVAQAVKAK
jgi:large subunit ribosomal protein L3